MTTHLVDRDIFREVYRHISAREITVLIGARQTGKTTLVRQVFDKLISDRKATASQLRFYNLDLVSDWEVVRDQAEFIKYLKEELKREKFLYVALDEVQRLDNPGKFLKGVQDEQLPVKFIVTGSSVLEMRSKVSESLSGRKRVFHVKPFSFYEFVGARKSSLRELLGKRNISAVNKRALMGLFFDFSVFGGYPRVVFTNDEKERIHVLDEIYSSYIEKDIVGILKVKNRIAFMKAVTLIAGRTSSLMNAAEYSNTLGLNIRTVDNYLQALENTFIINFARPYFTNITKELTKMPKVYFCDNGLRNYAVKYFASFLDSRDKGVLFENFVYSELSKIENASAVHYWRTKEGIEVDFIVKDFYGNVIPIEAKATEFSTPDVPKSLRMFIESHQLPVAFVVNLGFEGKTKVNDTTVYYILPWQINSIFEHLKK